MIEEIKKQERKLYKKYLLFLIVGIAIGILGFSLKGWLGNVLVILGVLIVIITLHLFSNAFNIYHKLKGKLREEETGEPFKETYIEWPGWVQKYGGIIFMLVIMIGFRIFGAMHENDFGGIRFVWHSLLFGLMAGFAINSLLKLKFTNWSSSRNKSYEIAFWIILSSIFICVCFSPVVNKYFAKADLECNNYQLLRQGKNYKTGTKYIHVLVNGKKERFSPSYGFFDQLSDKDTAVILCKRKGFLGYEYVEEFRLSK